MFFLQKLENSATEVLKDALPQLFFLQITKNTFCEFALIQKVSEVIFQHFHILCASFAPKLTFSFFWKKRD